MIGKIQFLKQSGKRFYPKTKPKWKLKTASPKLLHLWALTTLEKNGRNMSLTVYNHVTSDLSIYFKFILLRFGASEPQDYNHKPKDNKSCLKP